ncbi:hypothetical protein BC938DRAFT_478318 [Jimgerdemannia flammicorona]|uniref:Ubiquitin-like domain-containing protein n=1 Tax=Jimgerdemannia flammicorona TaxID=994334 RepID=A0A433QN37_9FUNG|nr:hypothetical protein BC938DRAFT_478318 [Jimgerdemannia flammicorona]
MLQRGRPFVIRLLCSCGNIKMSAANGQDDEKLRDNKFNPSPDDISIKFRLLDGNVTSLLFKKSTTLTLVYDKLDRGFNSGGAIYTLSRLIDKEEYDDLTDRDEETLEELGIREGSELIMVKTA